MGVTKLSASDRFSHRSPRVAIRHLSYSRGDRQIFTNVDMDIPAGQITVIMGPSGVGKTTLLRLIGAELHPDHGTIEVDEQNVHAMSRASLYRMRQRLGLLFQSGALFTDMSVFDNVAFPLREHTALSPQLISHIVKMKLDFVGLRGAHHLMPAQLSGGMARRVAFARAIALDPVLMLYDEPFTGQDPISLAVLAKLIKQLNQFLNTTTVIVSHDVVETMAIADRVYVLSEGQVVGAGSPVSLTNHRDPYVQQFLHGKADGVIPFHYPAATLDEDLFHA